MVNEDISAKVAQHLHDVSATVTPRAPAIDRLNGRVRQAKRRRQTVVGGGMIAAVAMLTLAATSLSSQPDSRLAASAPAPGDTSTSLAPTTVTSPVPTTIQRNVAPLKADLDGDGVDDAVVVVDTSDTQSLSARVDATLSSKGAQSISIYRDVPTPQIAAAADVNGDGRDELFVEVNRGNGLASFIVLRLTDEQLVQVQSDPGPEPFLLRVGRYQSGDNILTFGFECTETVRTVGGRELVRRQSEVVRGSGSAKGNEEVFTMSGQRASIVDTRSESFGEGDNSRAAKYSVAACDDSRLS